MLANDASRPLVIAHRGASGTRPENTFSAYERALALGADMIEIDLHLTRDGAIVITHDENLAGLGGDGMVGDVDLASVRGLDAGDQPRDVRDRWPNRRDPGAVFPSHCACCGVDLPLRVGGEIQASALGTGRCGQSRLFSFADRHLFHDLGSLLLTIRLCGATFRNVGLSFPGI